MKNEEIWVCYSISVHPNLKKVDADGRWQTNFYHRHLLKRWDYPQWIIRKHDRFFHWMVALAQVRFPQHYIHNGYYAYFPDTKEKLASKRQLAISAAKSQLTRYQNKIELLKQHCAGTLFSDYTQHPVYAHLKAKLEEKKLKLELAVKAKIEEVVL